MNKKGEVGIGQLIMIAIIAIVGAIFLVAIAQETGETLNTAELNAFDIGVQTNGTTYYFADYKFLSGITITGNITGIPTVSDTLTSDNYTITNNVINPTTGALTVSLLPTSKNYTGTTWNITATTAQPLTYVSDSGARGIMGLIVILFALAIAVVILEPTLKSGILNWK